MVNVKFLKLVWMKLLGAGSKIVLSWSPMRLKILHWRPEFHNWSPAGDYYAISREDNYTNNSFDFQLN